MTLEWVSSVCLGGLLVFCAYSALCFSAFPVGWCAHHSYLGLLGSAMLGSPVDPESGSLQCIILFSHRRGECTGICLFIAVTKIPRKKEKSLLLFMISKVFNLRLWFSCFVPGVRQPKCVMAEAAQLWQLGSLGVWRQAEWMPSSSSLLYPAKWFFLVAHRT